MAAAAPVIAIGVFLFFMNGLVFGRFYSRDLVNPDLLYVNLTLIPSAAAKGAGLFVFFFPFFNFYLFISGFC